jgi:hypothetical protein
LAVIASSEVNGERTSYSSKRRGSGPANRRHGEAGTVPAGLSLTGHCTEEEAMRLRSLHQVIAVALMSGVAVTAYAAGGTGAATHADDRTATTPAASTSAANATAPATSASDASPATSSTRAHRSASGQKAQHAWHGTRSAHHVARGEAAAMRDGGDRGYRAALRRCVEGPQSQRDGCLDQAIREHERA